MLINECNCRQILKKRAGFGHGVSFLGKPIVQLLQNSKHLYEEAACGHSTKQIKLTCRGRICHIESNIEYENIQGQRKSCLNMNLGCL